MNTTSTGQPQHIASATVIDTCYAGDLQVGDLIHVREDGYLSIVTGAVKGRAATWTIALSNHAPILVAGEQRVCLLA